MQAIALAAIFERVTGPRLSEVERHILSWPTLFPSVLSRCDLALRRSSRAVMAVAHFDGKGFGPDTESRFQFWATHAGGRPFSAYLLGKAERVLFEQQLARCEVRETGLRPDQLEEGWARVSQAAGSPEGRRTAKRFAAELEVDLGANGGLAVTADISEGGVFVASPLCPPVGDKFRLRLRLPHTESPYEVDVRVAHARLRPTVKPRLPAGFGLQFLSPPDELTRALAQYFSEKEANAQLESRRVHPRHEVSAPVRVTPVTSEPPAPRPPRAPVPEEPPAPNLSVTYDDVTAAREDCVKNLSFGGAFIKSSAPLPLHSKVKLDFQFPSALTFRAFGKVVHVHPGVGMGVQFELDAEGRAQLQKVIAQLTEPGRRALVVDPDVDFRRRLSAALKTQGFDVLEADSPQSGFQLLLDSLLNLDAVVLRDGMPKLGSQTLAELIRRTGGETELVLALVGEGPPPPGAGIDVMLAPRAPEAESAERVARACKVRASGRAGGAEG